MRTSIDVRRKLTLGLTVAGLSAALMACGDEGSSSSGDGGGDELKVGLSSAFSGDVAFYGQNAKRGVEYAIEDLKKSEPELDIKLVTADDACMPDGGASAYRELTQVEQVDVVLGSTCSAATLAGMPVLASSSTPGMTFSSASPEISAKSGVGGNDWSWRMNIDDSIMGNVFAKLIADKGPKRIAIMAPQTEFGQAAVDTYSKALPDAGVEVVSTQLYPAASGDLRAQLTKVDGANPDALLVFGAAADCAVMLSQMQELGMKLPIYSRSACASEEALKNLGSKKDLANGVLEAAYWAPSAEQDAFLSGFKEKYGDAPDYNAGLAYTAMMTIVDAVKGGKTDRQGINDALTKLDYASPIGPIAFDDHHQAHPDLFILTVEDGKLKILETLPTDG